MDAMNKHNASIHDTEIMKRSLRLLTFAIAILCMAWSLRAADQTKTIFSDVQQIVFLKKGDPQTRQIIISDPAKVKRLMDAMQLERNDLLVCDMAWQVSFIEKTGTVATFVCKGCVEIHPKDGSELERFKPSREFDELVNHIEEWR